MYARTAPGFQTNVQRIRVTPEIAARLSRGEEVSPEEIAAASARADENARRTSATATSHLLPEETQLLPEEILAMQDSANEWLPPSITAPKKKRRGKRR